MRVTHQLVMKTVLNNIQRNLGHMDRLQNMLSSGKALSRPSDDPIKVARVMSHTSALARNEQYQKNIEAAHSWMNATEDALIGIGEVLQRARELAVTGANGSMSESARKALAMEIDELTNILVQMGNSSYEGRYIFAGFQTNTVPFSRDTGLLAEGAETSIAYHGDQGSLNWEVAPGVTVRGSLDGVELFQDLEIFKTMEKLALSLNENDQSLIDASIEPISSALDHILDKRAAIGAITNGLEMTMEKYRSENINIKELRSKLEDIDFAEAYMNFAMMENIYQASISTGARIIQPSLLDFLR